MVPAKFAGFVETATAVVCAACWRGRGARSVRWMSKKRAARLRAVNAAMTRH